MVEVETDFTARSGFAFGAGEDLAFFCFVFCVGINSYTAVQLLYSYRLYSYYYATVQHKAQQS